MKFILITLFLILSIETYSQAQANLSGGVTYLNKNENTQGNNSKKKGFYVGPHILGDTITMLLNKFENDYVYFETLQGAYGVEEKKVIKPELYSSIKKIEKKYSKGVKKEKIASDLAYSRLKLILQKGIKLMNYNTTKVESDLKNIKSLEAAETYILNLKFN